MKVHTQIHLNTNSKDLSNQHKKNIHDDKNDNNMIHN